MAYTLYQYRYRSDISTIGQSESADIRYLNMNSRIARVIAIVCGATLIAAVSTYAQGSIFGEVYNSDASIPANGDIQFFGFLDDTDEEIRIHSSTGAGYENGNWFDDFQNYLTEAAGNPYDYYFFNTANGERFHLQATIPKNSFQQENVQLSGSTWPTAPAGVTAVPDASGGIAVSWTEVAGETVHIYRRMAQSDGSFFRVDNVSGSLTDRGVSGGVYVDASADTSTAYEYILIAETDAGDYSPPSGIATYDPFPSSCCIGNRGDVNGSNTETLDISDITYLVIYMFKQGPEPPCFEEADVNGSGGIDILDLTYSVIFAFQNGPAPVACP